MKVLILTEAGAQSGLGHIMRCLAIADAFKSKNIDVKVILQTDQQELIQLSSYIVLYDWINSPVNNILENTDVVILDSYLANEDKYKSICVSVKFCAYIDDYTRIDYPNGVVLNSSIYAPNLKYPQREGLYYLLGRGYHPLRSVFSFLYNEKVINDKIDSILVTFGGADDNNQTKRILKLLVSKFPNLKKNVIIGPAFSNVESIIFERDKNTLFYYSPCSEEMLELMMNSDIAISSGGQTLYELARVGVPTIATLEAENQINNIEGFKEQSFIEYAGEFNSRFLLDEIEIRIYKLSHKDLRLEKSQKGKALVDGLGCERIVNFIIDKVQEIHVKQ